MVGPGVCCIFECVGRTWLGRECVVALSVLVEHGWPRRSGAQECVVTLSVLVEHGWAGSVL